MTDTQAETETDETTKLLEDALAKVNGHIGHADDIIRDAEETAATVRGERQKLWKRRSDLRAALGLPRRDKEAAKPDGNATDA